MEGFGEILGEIFGERVFGEAEERMERREEPAYVYERYLCGGPKYLNINDR